MTQERFGLIQFDGVDQTIIGEDLEVGEKAPEFIAVGQDWSEVNPLREASGKVRVLAAVPSLETSVCDRETRRFNEEAVGLGEEVVIYVISMDLPFTQKRWCGAAGVDRVRTLSDHKFADFGPKYGVLIKEKRLLRRAVFVVDRDDDVVYRDYLPALGDEPNYEEVLKAVQKALA
ncbi:MAG: thiol peroxidase [Anaerolineales bacterium]|nr:thiol peroxidase [Anaerolineales bacterium]